MVFKRRGGQPASVEPALNAALTAAGIAMLCLGGRWLVSGSVSVARRFGVSDVLVGLTVVAYGTSTPELAVGLAAVAEHPQILLGNVVGSNVANVGLVVGISATVAALAVKPAAVRRELLVMVGASALLVLVSLDGAISAHDGFLMLGLLAAFTVATCAWARRSRSAPSGSLGYRPVALLALGVALLYAGSQLTVDNAAELARSFGISEKVIGLTVVAVGTSLPELITSLIAIRRGEQGIGIGNIVGSNIYNILMIVGASAAVSGMAVSGSVHPDYAVMMAFALALLLVLRSGRVPRAAGALLASGYGAYVAFTLL